MASLLVRGGTFITTSHNVSVPLRGPAMSQLTTLKDGYLLAENGLIKSIGALSDAPARADQIVDATGRHIFPGWCDSHSHIVYAQSREEEFVMRIRGMSYEEIAAAGGGILNSAEKLQVMSEDLLYEQAMGRLHEMIHHGTTALEIKSGYGLTVDSELKMLRVIRKIKENTSVRIKSTFLGAHAIPGEYRQNREGYIRLIIDSMIPRVVDEGLAEYLDVFCDRGFFTIDESERILEAGVRAGLRPKIHVSEIDNIGGVQMGIRYGALSVDHLECAGPEEVKALSQSDTIATLLPSCAFFLNLGYGPARALIDAGAAVALATDYNPGSTPSGKMPFVLALACLKMQMVPEEAINAATINGACAMEVQDETGSLTPGKSANFFITEPIPSPAFIPYAFGGDHVQRVFVRGAEYI
jgi:imidazolonepropionase